MYPPRTYHVPIQVRAFDELSRVNGTLRKELRQQACTTYPLPCTTHPLPCTTHPLPCTHHSPCTYYSLLTTHCLLLTTYYGVGTYNHLRQQAGEAAQLREALHRRERDWQQRAGEQRAQAEAQTLASHAAEAGSRLSLSRTLSKPLSRLGKMASSDRHRQLHSAASPARTSSVEAAARFDEPSHETCEGEAAVAAASSEDLYGSPLAT